MSGTGNTGQDDKAVQTQRCLHWFISDVFPTLFPVQAGQTARFATALVGSFGADQSSNLLGNVVTYPESPRILTGATVAMVEQQHRSREGARQHCVFVSRGTARVNTVGLGATDTHNDLKEDLLARSHDRSGGSSRDRRMIGNGLVRSKVLTPIRASAVRPVMIRIRGEARRGEARSESSIVVVAKMERRMETEVTTVEINTVRPRDRQSGRATINPQMQESHECDQRNTHVECRGRASPPLPYSRFSTHNPNAARNALSLSVWLN